MLLPVSCCVRGTVLVNNQRFVHSREDLLGVAHRKRLTIRTYPKSTVNEWVGGCACVCVCVRVCVRVCVCTRTCLHVYGLFTLFTDLSSLLAVLEFHRIINGCQRGERAR